ncbi:FAD/NAD(P)-binding protein [Azospirillum sp. ST 5-10]|uniref:FAD/NAD(P)-binding protein n=1 Tax=unclassified Azospirillum TaxID=2630922 RepID=UPI003F4A4C5F
MTMDLLAPAVAPPPAALDPMIPRPFVVQRVKRELSDTFTLWLRAEDGRPFAFLPGQFNMLYAFGVGEVPISISGDPADPAALVHTIRSVGKVTEALGRLGPGATVGVRGPFGSAWPVASAQGQDVVFVAGGVGLAPLRPAIYRVLAERAKHGNVVILYGARTPEDMLFARELQQWRGRFDVSVHVTVDRVTGSWAGKVGVVTNLIRAGGFDRRNAVAFVCGPEVMMRYAAEALVERGTARERVWLSMERNMKCAVGFCGHCQFGPTFVCRDGPVYRYDALEKLLTVWEL